MDNWQFFSNSPKKNNLIDPADLLGHSKYVTTKVVSKEIGRDRRHEIEA